MDKNFLEGAIKQFRYYESLGTRTLAQLQDEDLFREPATDTNSIALIVKHLHGNMLSRWTDFLTSDGEKEWRDREDEFEATLTTREAVDSRWQAGWACLFQAIEPLSEADMDTIIYIRNEGHMVMEAILRQLCHYSYHVGQIVYLGKIARGKAWSSLSIPKGGSKQFNEEKFSQEKSRRHFTDSEQENQEEK